MTERVGSIGRHADFEDGVARRGNRFQKAACPGRRIPRRSTRMPSSPPAPGRQEPQFGFGAEHALAGHAADLARSDGQAAAGKCVPSGASATSPPGSGTLGAPQITRCSLPSPRSTVTRRSPDRAGMRLDLPHSCDDQRLEPRAVRVNSLDLEAGAGQPLGDFFGRRLELRKPARLSQRYDAFIFGEPRFYHARHACARGRAKSH